MYQIVVLNGKPEAYCRNPLMKTLKYLPLLSAIVSLIVPFNTQLIMNLAPTLSPNYYSYTYGKFIIYKPVTRDLKFASCVP